MRHIDPVRVSNCLLKMLRALLLRSHGLRNPPFIALLLLFPLFPNALVAQWVCDDCRPLDVTVIHVLRIAVEEREGLGGA